MTMKKSLFRALMSAALAAALLLLSVSVTAEDTQAPGVLDGVELVTGRIEAYGFSVPYPQYFRQGRYSDGGVFWESTYQTEPYLVTLDYVVYDELGEFCEDPDIARKYYPGEEQLAGTGLAVLVNEEIATADGHPAHIYVLETKREDGEPCTVGFLYYARNNRAIRARLFSEPRNGSSGEELRKVSREDLVRVMEGIRYDSAKAPISVLDGAITVTTKEGTGSVTAGQKLSFVASFANPEKVNAENRNDAVEWSVSAADGGKLPAGVSINRNGILSTGRTNEILRLEVRAESPVFHVSATFLVTVFPPAKKISVTPNELFFYTGTDMPQEARAVLEPEGIPLRGITWTPSRKDIVEITPDDENGTAAIRALAAGKITVTVREPGGKGARLTVNVVVPVESVELEVKGKAKPGSTVTVKETIAPKQAGNKKVEWSVDVGEDVATISKGKLKISRNAPAGTVITVTCTAVGAPEPVVATIQVEVVEK